MKNSLKSVLFFGILISLFDQAVKVILSDKLALNNTIVLIKDLFKLTLVHNEGAAFSILSDNRIFLIAIGVFALLLISVYVNTRDNQTDFDIFTHSLLVGGILGNVIDRIVRGYVIDYISFSFGKFSFPVFNLADVCIVASIILIILKTIKEDTWNDL